jgi:hypothetical protein
MAAYGTNGMNGKSEADLCLGSIQRNRVWTGRTGEIGTTSRGMVMGER